MVVTDIKKFTDYWKNKFPGLYSKKTDEEIFNLARERWPDLEIPSYKESLLTQLAPTKKQEAFKEESLSDFDTDPAYVDSWFITGDLIPESFRNKGFVGTSPEFWRDQYNKSIPGLIYKGYHGIDKYGKHGEDGTAYDMENYDPNFAKQAAQFGLGFLSPLSAMVMLTTGALGKVAQVVGRGTMFGGTRFLQRGLLSSFANKYPKIGTGLQMSLEGALSMGVGGGAFAASHAAAHSTAKQRMSEVDEDGRGIGNVNIKKVMQDASDEFLHSLPVFAAAGGITHGLMGSVYGYSKAYGAQTSLGKKITQAVTHPLSRIPVEAGLFTAIPSITGDEGAPKLGSTDFWKNFGTNLFIVGGMRGIGAVFEPQSILGGKFDAMKFFTTEMRLEKNLKNTTGKSLDNVTKDIGGRNIPPELREKSLQILRDDLNTESNLKIGRKDLNFILDFNKNLNKKSFAKKIALEGSKESKQFAKYSDLVNTYSVGLAGVIKDVLADPVRLKENYKAMFGKYPNPTEVKSYEGFLKNIEKNVYDKRNIVDKEIRGNIEDRPGDDINENWKRKDNDDFYLNKDIKKAKDDRIIDLVNELSKESGRTQTDLKADKTFQKQVQGEWFLSESKLEKALAPYRADRGGIADLKTKRKEVKEDLDGHYKKTDYGNIGGRENVQDYAVRKLGKDNDFYHDALYGFNKYVSKRVAKSSPGHYKTLIDYFKYLKENNLVIREATSIITERYAKQNNLTKPQKKTLNDALSSFYGTGDAGGRKGIQTGFAYDFMTRHGRVPSVAVLGKGWGTPDIARKGVIAVAAPGEYKKFSNIKKKNLKVSSKEQQIGIINIKDGIVSFGKRKSDGSLRKGARQHRVESLDAAIDMLYEFGARGVDVLERLKIKDFDWKNGYIRVFSTGEGAKGLAGPRIDIPLREVIPELWKKLEKVKGNRDPNSKELLFANDKGNILTKDFINKFIKETIPRDLVFYGDKKSFTVQDFRRMIESDASGTKWQDFIDLKLVAHKGKETRTTYIHKEFVKEWKEWRAHREGEAQKLFEPTIGLKEKRTKHLPEEVIYKTDADKAARDKFIEEVLKKNNLSPKDLKREGLDKGVLGSFAEGTIKLQKGLWQPSDFYHENLHRLKAFARASNNKGLQKLIERGESLAKNTKEYTAWKKKNVGRDVEEFLADIAGGKASQIQFTKGMLGKVKNFVNQLVSRVKVAFGAGNFKDISNILAKRVQKGFSTEGIEFAKGQVRYRLEGMDSAKAVKYAKGVLEEIYKEGELTIAQKDRMIRHIGEVAGLGDNFKLLKDTPVEYIETFIATINTMDKAALRRLPNKTEWWVNFKDAEKMRIIKNITESERKTMLKNLDVTNGDYYNASARQLRDFMEILGTMDDVKKSTTSWIDEKVANDHLDKGLARRFKRLNYAKAGLPVSTVMESIGLKGLANKLYTHTSKELDHLGKFTNFEVGMQKATGKRKWNKVKDMIYLFDKERYKERLNSNLLSSAEKNFVKEQINMDSWTAKGTIAKEYISLMKYYKDELMIILKEVLNDAEFEKFKNDKNISWLDPEKNVYVQRRLTKEFKKHYDTSGNHFKKLIEEQTDAIAFKLAKRYFKEKKISNPSATDISKKAAELRDFSNSLAHQEVYELFEFNINKYSPSFLKKRHVKLPEHVTIDGKKIQVYETNFGLTIKDYAINQSKFLANIEFFPEFVKLKGFDRPGAKQLLNEIKSTDENLGKWVRKRIESHLNIDKNSYDYPDGVRMTRHITSTIAKLQLSFPTSGLKNFLIGQSQNLLIYRLRDFIGGFVDVIHKDNRAMVRGTGATEIGLRYIELKGVTGKIDKFIEHAVFKWGGMRPTEHLNRYISVLAGKRDQAHLVRRIQNSGEGSWGYNNAINKFKRFYKLTDADISLLKEYGMNGVKGTEPSRAALNRRALETVYQKMNTFAHINTQGAAINLFMPDWGAGPMAQSALLFKRMAFAASANTTRSISIAMQNKSPLPLLFGGLGTWLSGEAMIAVYDKLLGQPMPKENSSKGRMIKTSLFKGEFLGLGSEIFSPYERGWYSFMMPAVLSTIGATIHSLYSILAGEKYASQGITDILRGSTGLVNGTYKVYKQGLLAGDDGFAKRNKRARGLWYDYLEEVGDADELLVQTETEISIKRSPVEQSFRNLFYSGRDEDLFGNSLGKWYVLAMFSKANDIYYYERELGNPISVGESMKRARKNMKTLMRNLNPNKAYVYTKEKKARAIRLRKAKAFVKWLDAKGRNFSSEYEKVQAQYGYRHDLTLKQAEEFRQSANLDKILKEYGITFF